MKPKVRRASVDDLDVLAPLFDAYRQFYRRPSAIDEGRHFLGERLQREQSTVFLAFQADTLVGFTQLFPSFSSASLRSILILNDLFVSPAARGTGAGRSLLEAAASYGREVGAVRLCLSTETTNAKAQAIYEHLGWRRSTGFHEYGLTL